MFEIKALHRKIAEYQGIEQRCQKAETVLKSTEARNQLLGDCAPLGIFIINAQGYITGINRKMQEIFPWPSGKDSKSISPSESQTIIASDIFADVKQCIVHQKSHIAERSYSDHQGACTHLRYHLNPIPGANGTITEVMAIVENCTDLKRAERALQESEKRYRQLYQSAPIAMIERDTTLLRSHIEQLQASGVSDLRKYLVQNPSRIHHCWSLIKTVDQNPAFVKLMGLENCVTPDTIFPQTDSEAFREMAREIILAVAQRKSENERELTLVTAGGEEKFILGKSMMVSGYEATQERVVIALVDISQRKKAEEILRESEQQFKNLSLRDNLTGLFNRRYLYQSLAALIESGKTDGTQLSLIFMDLDHFKQVVDTHGHLNGSRAIREVAHTINSCLQEPAYAVAYAGDEFVVVLPGHDQTQAFQKANDIHACMRDSVYMLDQYIEVRLQASFGIATFPEDALDVDALLAAADQALFDVKDNGKNGIRQYKDIEGLRSLA